MRPAGGARHQVAVTERHPDLDPARVPMVFDLAAGLYWRPDEGGLLFGMMMLLVGGLMLRRPHGDGRSADNVTRPVVAKLAGVGLLVGMLSGFFGIGGGFLIVPGLIVATGMPMIFAVGSSLVSVAAFGFATAGNYAMSGFVDWVLVAFFIGGGIAGSVIGRMAGRQLSSQKHMLTRVFAAVVGLVGIYVVVRGAQII